MIVVDASVVVELLRGGPLAGRIGEELIPEEGPMLAPDLLDMEVLSAFRNLARGKWIDSHQMGQILDTLAVLPVDRCAHLGLAERVWELRHNFTVYDAAYIALAELSGATLYTCDAKLRKGHRSRVRVVGGGSGASPRYA